MEDIFQNCDRSLLFPGSCCLSLGAYSIDRFLKALETIVHISRDYLIRCIRVIDIVYVNIVNCCDKSIVLYNPFLKNVFLDSKYTKWS